MSRRELLLRGPKELVGRVTELLQLVDGRRMSSDRFRQRLSLLANNSRELRKCAGNSNLSETNVEQPFSIKNIMDLSQHMAEFWDFSRSAMVRAEHGPRELSEAIGTRSELEQYLEEHKDEPTTAIQVGLEGLEKVNNTYGRKSGDNLLVAVADTLKNMVEKDTQIFQEGSNLVLVGNWDSPDAASAFAENITESVKATPNGRMLRVTIGIAYEEKGDVLHKVESARIQSDGIGVFNPDVAQVDDKRRKDREAALAILASKQFYPEYQRIVTKPSSRFSKAPLKYEALWRSKDLTPFQFFREIKEENRIHEVTEVMLPKIMTDLARKPKAEVAVNVTAEEMCESFGGKPFANYVGELLAKFKIKPSNFIIELVEWGDEDRLSEDSLKNLARLVRHGCRLALDDYGVRSSNLVRLMQLCEANIIPDYLKIDAALIKGFDQYLKEGKALSHDHFSVLGIRNIVSLARDLSKSFSKEIGIVAEFVSNEKLRLSLENEGVDHFQGFFLAKPVPGNKAFG